MSRYPRRHCRCMPRPSDPWRRYWNRPPRRDMSAASGRCRSECPAVRPDLLRWRCPPSSRSQSSIRHCRRWPCRSSHRPARRGSACPATTCRQRSYWGRVLCRGRRPDRGSAPGLDEVERHAVTSELVAFDGFAAGGGRDNARSGKQLVPDALADTKDGRSIWLHFTLGALPEVLFVHLVWNCEIQAQRDVDRRREVDGRESDPLEAELLGLHAQETGEGNLELLTGLGCPGVATGDLAGAEIQLAPEVGELALVQVKDLAPQLDPGVEPVHRVDHEGDPIRDALVGRRFLQVVLFIYAVQIAPDQGVAGVALIEVPANAHVLVAQ